MLWAKSGNCSVFFLSYCLISCCDKTQVILQIRLKKQLKEAQKKLEEKEKEIEDLQKSQKQTKIEEMQVPTTHIHTP